MALLCVTVMPFLRSKCIWIMLYQPLRRGMRFGPTPAVGRRLKSPGNSPGGFRDFYLVAGGRPSAIAIARPGGAGLLKN